MRRISREYVFKLVFEYTFNRAVNDETLDLMLADCELNDEDRDYVKTCYCGIAENLDAIKARIGEKLQRYTVDRLYRPDLVVLAIAVYELDNNLAPAKVVVNEAVTLAKKYGTEKSGAFVNGVLAKFVE